MNKINITHPAHAPKYFYDGSVLYTSKGIESYWKLSKKIKTEFLISEVRTLDKGGYIIKSEITTPPQSLRKLFFIHSNPDETTPKDDVYVYVITYNICKEKVDGITTKLINGELRE